MFGNDDSYLSIAVLAILLSMPRRDSSSASGALLA
jgi:hypothetical protein